MRFRALNRIETRQKLTEHMDLAQKAQMRIRKYCLPGGILIGSVKYAFRPSTSYFEATMPLLYA